MTDDLDVLRSALDTIEAPAMGLDRLERRRAHNARTARLGAGLAVAAVIGVAAVVAVSAVGMNDEQRPAGGLEGGALRQPGEVLVVTETAQGEGVYARVTGELDLRPLALVGDIKAGASPGETWLSRAAWSTDGDRMVFELDPIAFSGAGCSSAAGLWVVDDVGPHQLTRACAGSEDRPSPDLWTWLPGTATLALVDNDQGGDQANPSAALQVIDTVGGDRRTLATVDGLILAAPTPTTDGRTLFWISEPDGGRSAVVYATTVADGATRTIATLHRSYRNIAISPDGSRLALAGDNVRIITMDGDVLREVETGDANGSPAWSPDGRMLAWSAHSPETRSRSLYVWRTEISPSEPGAVRRLERGEEFGDHVRWSPDGRTVAYLAVIDTYSFRKAWKRYDVETGAQQQNMDPDVAQSWTDGSWNA